MKLYSYIYDCSHLLMQISALVAIIFGIIKRNRAKELKFLFIYPLASLIETLGVSIVNSSALSASSKLLFTRGAIHCFLIVEFLVMFHFFSQIIKAKTVTFSIYLLRLIYVPLIIAHFFLVDTSKEQPETLYILQGLLILYPGLFYFIELFKQPALLPLGKEPHFWVAIGANAYFACTLPLFFMKNVVFNKQGYLAEIPVYAINMLSYSFFFLLIIKAYQCRKKETQ